MTKVIRGIRGLSRRQRLVATAATLSVIVCSGTAAAVATAHQPDVEPDPSVTDTSVEDESNSPLIRPGVLIAKLDPMSAVTPNGTPLWRISAETPQGIPERAEQAYKAAAQTMLKDQPGCHLPWELLAGIGRIESDHGRFGGSQLDPDGLPQPAIRGVALNGVGPVAAISDSDDGRFDGDLVWDRAVGPMQFIPTTWASSGRDGDLDGVKNPNDIDDASLAAASYLCPDSGSLEDIPTLRSAIFSYNASDYYVDLVIAYTIGYKTGTFTIPSPPVLPPKPEDEDPKGDDKGDKGNKPDKDKPGNKPDKIKDDPKPDKPPTPDPTPEPPTPTTPTPKPPPTTTPPPPQTVDIATFGGVPFTSCGGGWCGYGNLLDLGGRDGSRAAADFDDDGSIESNGQEFAGLDGRAISIGVKRHTKIVYTINGKGYRNADGSFSS